MNINHIEPIDLAAELARTEQDQAAAAEPTTSVWVSANAGTGKTHVLKTRVLRLLLAGTPPERLLCLTYTKTAAAEMSHRVFGDLATWATTDDATLDIELSKLTGRQEGETVRARARQLFAQAIETPGGLKVQTIHAFCERLLKRFPLEAGVAPNFSVLDDGEATHLQRQAILDILGRATLNNDSALADALAKAAIYAADESFDRALMTALNNRTWIEAAVRIEPDASDPISGAANAYRRALGLPEGTDVDTLDDALAEVLSDTELARLAQVWSGGSKTDQQQAQTANAARATTRPTDRIDRLADLFLTQQKLPKKRLLTKKLVDEHPDIAELLVLTQRDFSSFYDQRTLVTAIDATIALLRLADHVMQRYTDIKAARAQLDFEDLLQRTSHLLSSSSSAEWVLYKLDGGLDHILVDEAQDTSPAQWSIVSALAREFFAGSGARDDAIRTVFAVGDEKQSIYGFQGAAPKMFADMGVKMADAAITAGLPWRQLPLTLSFRSVSAVLTGVDRVFSDRNRVGGVTAGDDTIRHIANRAGQAGLIEVWPTEVWEDAEDADLWDPRNDSARQDPAEQLAQRIAKTIQAWLHSEEQLPALGRAVRPGDVLILVRRRRPFAEHMVRALKAHNIPVAGADRMRITKQIGVMDLMALGDFLLLPEDDLALASILKSPFFGLDDEDLLAIAHGRKGSLWTALLAHAEANERYKEATTWLTRWRARADFVPPFEFFAGILDSEIGRRRLLARLGSEAADALDEFLNLAIRYDEQAPPSLQGFLDWLRRSEREIKRDMEQGRNEVRVMTVHAAKGLEAPIVFLPDTCSARFAARAMHLVDLRDVPWPVGADKPLLWPVAGAGRLEQVRNSQHALNLEEREEYHRLLYVAMTRARDRLYIAGFESKRGRDDGCWYDLVSQALNDDLESTRDILDQPVMRLQSEQSAKVDKSDAQPTASRPAISLPDWATRNAPSEPQRTIPLAPSRLAPLESDEADEAQDPDKTISEPPMLPPSTLAFDNRFLRGTITHALLQYLPDIDPASWEAGAEAFVARRGAALRPDVRDGIVRETLAVLRSPGLAALFGPDSLAEVPIIAEVPPPNGKGPPLRIAGQIDRLVVLDDEALLVDYKTNRPPPHEPEQVADAYLLQLAAYKLAVSQCLAVQTVRAAIVWTDGARILEIPAQLLERYESRLWEVDKANLDD